MGRNVTLDSLLSCTHMTCGYSKKITKAAQMGNKAMFRAKDIRRAQKEMGEQGLEPVD